MSYEFDATTDRIELPDLAVPQTAGSLVWWVKPTWASTDGAVHFFWSWAFPNPWFDAQKYSDNGLYVGWSAGGGNDDRVAVASGNYTLNQDQWNVFVLTWSTSGGSVLYLNGTQIGSNGALDATFDTSQADIEGYLGNGDTGGGPAFNLAGRLAEVAIWNVVLSGANITALNITAPNGVDPSHLVNYWKLFNDLVDTIGAQNGTGSGVTQNADHPTFTSGVRRLVNAVPIKSLVGRGGLAP